MNSDLYIESDRPSQQSPSNLKRGIIAVFTIVGGIIGFFLIDSFGGTAGRIITMIELEPLLILMPLVGLLIGACCGIALTYPTWYIKQADNFNEQVGYYVSWLASALVFFVFLNVFLRYVLGFALLWVQELQWHLFGAMFLLGAAYTLKEDRHVRVDIIYNKLSPTNQARIDLVGSVLFLLGFCVVALFYSYEFVIRSYEMGEGSPNPGGLPARYIVKSAIPLGMLFLIIQGLAMMARASLTLFAELETPTLTAKLRTAIMPFIVAFVVMGGLYVALNAIPRGPVAMLFFGCLLASLMLGFPVAFTLAGVSIVVAFLTDHIDQFGFFPNRASGTIEDLILMAVPLFVYMGVTLEQSGLAEELLETMALLFGRVRGGLAISVVFVGALLAASTGIVGATVVTMGLLSLPTMIKRGYSIELATGTIAASGTLGQIIPPSIVLVLLGSVLNVPVGDMFIGGFMPGMMIVALYMLWILIIAFLRPKQAPTMPADELAAFKGMVAVRQTFVAFIPPVFLIMAVLGTILAGIATPTEAAGVGCVGALLLIMIKRRLSLPAIQRVMKETTLLTCMVFMIIIGAGGFTIIFKALGGPSFLKDLVLSFNLSPMTFLAFSLVLIFIAGFFIDFIEITYIIVPVIYPIFIAKGVDILWLGILIGVNLQTSFITPPFGYALFYLKGVAPPEVKTDHIYRGVVPYIVIQAIALILLVMYPGISTCLPSYFSWNPDNPRQTTILVEKCGPTVANWFGAEVE